MHAYTHAHPTRIPCCRWWSEAVLGVPRWMCFDACPTFACLPHVAARAAAITPSAKLVVMVRDPVAALFSAETMLRNMGMPLSWSLAEQLQPQDMRFKVTDERHAHRSGGPMLAAALTAKATAAHLPAASSTVC